jgi:hypothetical protein
MKTTYFWQNFNFDDELSIIGAFIHNSLPGMYEVMIVIGVLLLIYLNARTTPKKGLSIDQIDKVDKIIEERIRQAKDLKLTNNVLYLIKYFCLGRDAELKELNKSFSNKLGVVFTKKNCNSEYYSIDLSIFNNDITIKVANPKTHYLPDDSCYEDQTITLLKEGNCVLSFKVDKDECPYSGISTWIPRETVDAFIPGEWLNLVIDLANKAHLIDNTSREELERERVKEEFLNKKKKFGIE